MDAVAATVEASSLSLKSLKGDGEWEGMASAMRAAAVWAIVGDGVCCPPCPRPSTREGMSRMEEERRRLWRRQGDVEEGQEDAAVVPAGAGGGGGGDMSMALESGCVCVCCCVSRRRLAVARGGPKHCVAGAPPRPVCYVPYAGLVYE